MPDTCLPKLVLYGQVKRRGFVGRPRKIWNNVLLSDTQSLNIARPHSDAHSDALEGKDCHCTHLAHAGTRIHYYYYYTWAAYSCSETPCDLDPLCHSVDCCSAGAELSRQAVALRPCPRKLVSSSCSRHACILGKQGPPALPSPSSSPPPISPSPQSPAAAGRQVAAARPTDCQLHCTPLLTLLSWGVCNGLQCSWLPVSTGPACFASPAHLRPCSCHLPA